MWFLCPWWEWNKWIPGSWLILLEYGLSRICWVILHSWRQSHPFQADHVSMEKIFLLGICCPWHWRRNPDLGPELITQQGCFTRHLFMFVDYGTKHHHFGRHHEWLLKFSHCFTNTDIKMDIPCNWFQLLLILRLPQVFCNQGLSNQCRCASSVWAGALTY